MLPPCWPTPPAFIPFWMTPDITDVASQEMAAIASATFGIPDRGIIYTERRAAYAVILGKNRTVATIHGAYDRFWLPGGGSLVDESSEETITREIREELARTVRPGKRFAEAIQYFYAPYDDVH